MFSPLLVHVTPKKSTKNTKIKHPFHVSRKWEFFFPKISSFFFVGLEKRGGKLSNTWCAMKFFVDFGSVDFNKMPEMQMQIAGFVSSYFLGFILIFPAAVSSVLDFPVA